MPPVVTDKASLLAAVQACGLVGVGGAGFPTHVKLAANTIDTLLINAAECEPYLTTDCREMLECSDTIISGITAVMKYCEIPHCIIGIERNKPECIDLLTSLTREMKASRSRACRCATRRVPRKRSSRPARGARCRRSAPPASRACPPTWAASS